MIGDCGRYGGRDPEYCIPRCPGSKPAPHPPERAETSGFAGMWWLWRCGALGTCQDRCLLAVFAKRALWAFVAFLRSAALPGETYALKAISKGYIVKTGMQESDLDPI